MDQQIFEASLPADFRALAEELGAVCVRGGDGIVMYDGFTAVATLSHSEAKTLSEETASALRQAWPTRPASPERR